MNAGFSRHWEKILAFDVPDKLLHKKDKIVKRIMGNYKRSLLLTTIVLGEDQLRKNTKEFNEKFGLKIETRPGTLTLLESAWEAAKRTDRRKIQLDLKPINSTLAFGITTPYLHK